MFLLSSSSMHQKITSKDANQSFMEKSSTNRCSHLKKRLFSASIHSKVYSRKTATKKWKMRYDHEKQQSLLLNYPSPFCPPLSHSQRSPSRLRSVSKHLPRQRITSSYLGVTNAKHVEAGAGGLMRESGPKQWVVRERGVACWARLAWRFIKNPWLYSYEWGKMGVCLYVCVAARMLMEHRHMLWFIGEVYWRMVCVWG